MIVGKGVSHTETITLKKTSMTRLMMITVELITMVVSITFHSTTTTTIIIVLMMLVGIEEKVEVIIIVIVSS